MILYRIALDKTILVFIQRIIPLLSHISVHHVFLNNIKLSRHHSNDELTGVIK